jgi:hypothetical protein
MSDFRPINQRTGEVKDTPLVDDLADVLARMSCGSSPGIGRRRRFGRRWTMSDEPLIDPSRVQEILVGCMYKDGEEVPEGAVIVEGILHVYALDPQRLETYRLEVTQMLQNLPLAFRPSSVEGGGGGWSFLNACQDANDVQWTGMHMTMEALFVLGIAMGLVEWALPRDLWSALPGGMPYVVVKV